MYPFDPDRALRGEPLVCRDGRRPSLCFATNDGDYPIRVVLPSGIAPYFTASGRRLRGLEDSTDLFMLESEPWPLARRLEAMLGQTARVSPGEFLHIGQLTTLLRDCLAAQEVPV